MTYKNRSHVKRNKIPVRLDDQGQERLEQVAMLMHMQPAALARKLLMERLDEVERRILERQGLKSG